MGQMLLRAGAEAARHVLPRLAQAAVHEALAPAPADGSRFDSLDIQTSMSGSTMARVWGRFRLAGEVIWASRYREHEHSSGGKGGGGGRQYSYSISLAVGLCEGVITGIGRIWANGEQLDTSALTLRLYTGTPDQQADPLIETVEGAEAPAFRDTAYVVFEDLELEAFGHRIPNLSFEVFRQGETGALETHIRGVNLIPGSGEFSLTTQTIKRVLGPGDEVPENRHAWSGEADIMTALDQLQRDLPACRSVQLVLSWFGTDLRCADCEIHPGVETRDKQTRPLSWSVAGEDRSTAYRVSALDGRPVYGGTPDDASVIGLIRELKVRGLAVTIYPFILMDIPNGNGLADPYGATEQSAFPWRGRIMADPAAATSIADQIAVFFGTASAAHFITSEQGVNYTGPSQWRFRRFILHCAALARAAGGVDGFLIGSEMVALTRSAQGVAYPAVAELVALSVEARALLGESCRLSYAADWSEYAGIQGESGERIFHLDPLWASAEIDAVAIDWYAPMTDWRDGTGHLDGELAPGLHDPAYLAAGLTRGEGYDWYYASEADRTDQIRTPIHDQAHGEDWIWRVKDLQGWWSNPHHDRPGGVRSQTPTGWVPRSKPVWLTEIGVPAVDKGTNQPNVFFDPKSSESALPHFSSGARDDLLQRRALEALLAQWREDSAHNPVSPVYAGPMVEPGWVHVWAYDARPFPEFPSRRDIWSDAENWQRGHWLNGRVGAVPVSQVISEICRSADLEEVDTGKALTVLSGYALRGPVSARAGLAPLLAVLGIEVWPRASKLDFVSAGVQPAERELTEFGHEPGEADLKLEPASTDARFRDASLAFVDDGRAYQPGWVWTDGEADGHRRLTLSGQILLDEALAGALARDRLSAANMRLETRRIVLPPSALSVEPGDLLVVDSARWQVRALDRQAQVTAQLTRPVPAGRAEHRVSRGAGGNGPGVGSRPSLAVLDLAEEGLWVAAATRRGEAPVLIATGSSLAGWTTRLQLSRHAVMGVLTAPLGPGPAGRWDRAAELELDLVRGELSSQVEIAVLNGANRLAVQQADGRWEILQFAEAEMIAPRRYRLTGLLRGLQGRLATGNAAVGALCVLLDDAVGLLPLSNHEIGRDMTVQARLAGAPVADTSEQTILPARGGLRPFAPVHLRLTGRHLSWIRRTRVDGDRWDIHPLPLGEVFERYRVTLRRDGHADWSTDVNAPQLTLPELDILATSPAGNAVCGLEVVQISDRAGAGDPARLELML